MKNARSMMLVPLLGLLALLPWSGRPLIEREQELRVAMTARAMARGAGWWIPSYQGEPRLNKPPLMYWITATAFKIAPSSTPPAWVTRLPNVLFGSGLLWLIATLGARLVGRRRALLAAAITGSCFLFLRFGRVGETDMALAFFLAFAGLALAIAPRSPQPWRWWLASALAAGLGFMIKGPAALVLPLVAHVAFTLTSPPASRRPPPVIPPLLWTLLVLLIAAPWYVSVFFSPAASAASQDVGYELGALLRHSKHEGSPLFYLYTLPAGLAPWSLLLPVAVVASWRRARAHAGLRFLIAWLVSSLVVMSLIRSKQIHYATLLLPPAALLCGAWLGARQRPGTRAVRFLRGYLLILASAGFLAGVLAAGAGWIHPFLSRATCLTLGLAAAGPAAFAFHAARRGRPQRALAGVVTALLALTALHAAELHELESPSRAVREFAGQARDRLAPGADLYLAGRRLNAMQFILDRRITRVASLEEGWAKARPGDLIILAADRNNRVLPAHEPMPPLLDHRQGKVTLRLYRR
jgi:4-amino-4-deoxy-L-arabinose transferase-like glycosyltransferase